MKLKLDMLGLVTADMSESIRFYRLLGIEIPDADPNEPYVEATLPNGLRFSWNKVEMVREIDPEWVEPVGQRIGAAFLCGSPQEVDDAYKLVVDSGFTGKREPWDAFWGQRYAQVEDPDGNVVDLFCPLP